MEDPLYIYTNQMRYTHLKNPVYIRYTYVYMLYRIQSVHINQLFNCKI